MSPLASLLIGLVVALVLAGAASGWLWRVHRRRLEMREGLKILAGMRWRELSNLVVEALVSAGFEPEPREQASERGGHAEVVVLREGRPWLLTCKQGLGYRVTAQPVEEMLRTLRVQQAGGGIIVTPGQVDPAARLVAPNIELVDGPELWNLVEHLLPRSVHEEICDRARSQAWRLVGGATAIACIVGVLLGWTLSHLGAGQPETRTPLPVATAPGRTAPAADTEYAPAVQARDDDESMRRELAQRLSDLPGVGRAVWATRSTLQVFLDDAGLASDTAICQVMDRYELLRASRLQLEPPPGSGKAVRFMQCRAY